MARNDFKGLTIRFGADYTDLKESLKVADAALRETKKQVKDLQKALEVNPSAFKLLDQQAKSLGDEAVAAGTRYAKLNKAIEEVKANDALNVLYTQTGDVTLQAQEALDRYNTLNSSLEVLKARLTGMWKELGGDKNLFKMDRADQEAALSLMSEVEGAVGNTARSYLKLRDSYDETSKALENYKKVAQARDADVQKDLQWNNLVGLAKQLREVTEQSEFASSAFGQSITRMNSAMDAIAGRSNELDRILEIDPTNLGAAEAKIRNMADSWKVNENRLKEFNGEIARLKSSGVERFSSNIETLDERIERLSNETDEAKAKLDIARGTVKTLTQETNKLEKGLETALGSDKVRINDDLKKTRDRLEKATHAADALENAFEGVNEELQYTKRQKALESLEDGADGARAKMKSLEGEMSAIQKLSARGIFPSASSLKSLGMTLNTTVTPAVHMALSAMVQSADEIDAAYRDMRKTVQGTETQFESLRQSAINFSSTHVTSADQLLEIEAIGGELGVATENLEAFATAVANIDIATNLDSESAAETLGHLQNIMHLSASDYKSFSDALVRLGNNGASTEVEIANIAERIGSMSAIVGMSSSDVLAWASTIASTGQKSEAAGTAISKTMSFMETAVSAAGGTIDTSMEAVEAAIQDGGDALTVFAGLAEMTRDELVEAWSSDAAGTYEKLSGDLEAATTSLQKIADVAHMTSDDFARAWEDNPTIALEAFIKGLNDIEASGGSADKTLVDLGITSVRQKQAIEGLMRTVGLLDDNIKMSENAWNGVSDEWGQAGDASIEAQRKAEGFSGQLQIMQNNAQNLGATIGEALVPYMHLLNDLLTTLNGVLSTDVPGLNTFIVMMGGILAASGPVTTGISSFTTVLDDMAAKMSKSGSAMGVYGKYLAKNEVRLADVAKGSKNYRRALDEVSDQLKKTAVNGQITAEQFDSLTTAQKRAAAAAKIAKAALATLAITLAIAAIAEAVQLLGKWIDQQRKLKASTEKAGDIIRKSWEKASASVSDYGDDVKVTLEDIRSDVDTYANRVVEANERIADSAEDTFTKTGLIDMYSGKIATLMDKAVEQGELTTQQQQELKAAVEGYNEEAGTSLEIIDAAKGKISKQGEEAAIAADQFRELARQEINAAKASFYSDAFKDSYSTLKEGAKMVERTAKAYEHANEEYEAALRGDFGTLSAEEMENFRRKRADAYAAYNDALNTNTANRANAQYWMDMMEIAQGADGAFEDLILTNENMSAVFEVSGKSVKGFEGVLSEFGVDVNDLATNNADKLIEMGRHWDGTVSSISGDIESLGMDVDENKAKLIDWASGASIELDAAGINVFDFVDALQEAGVDQDKALKISSADLALWASESGGDVQEVIDKINAYDATQPEPKQPTLDTNPAKRGMDDFFELVKQWNSIHFKAQSAVVDVSYGELEAALQKLLVFRDLCAEITGKGLNLGISVPGGQVQMASGGIINPVKSVFHADGGYIASRPTVVNIAGEAGAEAIIPLTNRRYVKPFASAIAGEMKGAGGNQTITMYITQQPGESVDVFAQRVAREMRRRS